MIVQPTITNRNHTLDLLRGVAVLGILLANIEAFSGVAMSEGMGMGYDMNKVATPLDSLLIAFVNGKFRGMLAVLFGIGLYMQFQKRCKLQGNWPGGYLKRTFWLSVIGAAHFIGIWFGDILFTYAVTAFVATFLVRVPDKALWWIIGGCFFAMLFFGGLIAAITPFIEKISAGKGGPFDMGSMLGNEGEIFAHGGYLEQVLFRLKFFALNMGGILVIVIDLLPLFLAGFLIVRHGVLIPNNEQGAKGRRLLWISLLLGLALNGLLGFLVAPWNFGAARTLAEFGIGSILALGYIASLSSLSWSSAPKWTVKPFEKVGRMALTSYIFQSILCTAFFYSWGMGLYEGIGPMQELCVVAAVWIIVIYCAELWLKFFDIGPLEWLLRSLTEGKKLPWRYKPQTEVAPPPPRIELGFDI